MPEQNPRACQLHESKVVLGAVFVANNNSTVVPKPGVQTLDAPSAFEPAKRSTILGGHAPIGSVGRDEFDVLFGELGVMGIAVIRLVANQSSGRILDKTGLNSSFKEGDLSWRSRRYVNGDRKASAVCNCHDLATFAALGLAHGLAPFFADTNVPSKKHSDRSSFPLSFKSSARPHKIRSKTPAATHSWKRKWQVEPDGYRFCGISFHWAPVRMIQSIPFMTARSGRRGRPLPSARALVTGMKGLIASHCPSSADS